MIVARALLAMLLVAALGAAQAQQTLYRWVDDKGKVHVTDTPPPPSAAKKVEEKSYGSSATAAPTPYELRDAQSKYPVTLYTAPSCKEPCTLARGALNKRGVPFKEIQVWNEETNAQLAKVSGTNEVPVLTVGRSVQKGFEQGAYDSLLDSAGYPRAGLLPEGKQARPGAPEGYVPPEKRAETAPPTAEPVKPKPKPELGPYAPRFSESESKTETKKP